MINVVVEGQSDEQMARTVVRAAGRSVDRLVIKRGKNRLDPSIRNYNRAAQHAPWVVFRDSDTQCPVKLHARLTRGIAPISPGLLLRIVHPMSEGWLMSDRRGFADYFKVRAVDVPLNPETLQNAKQTLLELCSRSRSRAIRAEMVTATGQTGPLYVTRINEFAASAWSVETAAASSDSLNRAIERIRQLPTTGR
ncbi:hypothetical protein [Nocardioides sp.]|jgi:hypothetical protein|uniref:hypothetical protein n=1 Tax=Nocardioides sp. TaxID=35761 RepID=UPI002C667C0E|nr:hypothetical protein [Nocardioides sp.]HVX55003.1 hypothetical protein [Nocardioides sp.]